MGGGHGLSLRRLASTRLRAQQPLAHPHPTLLLSVQVRLAPVLPAVLEAVRAYSDSTDIVESGVGFLRYMAFEPELKPRLMCAVPQVIPIVLVLCMTVST